MCFQSFQLLLCHRNMSQFSQYLNTKVCCFYYVTECNNTQHSRRLQVVLLGKKGAVSKCTTDLSSPFLSRSSVCLVCRQETGFRVSVRSRQSWGNVEKGWGFWGFHKRGSRNLFETILHEIQHANRVWKRHALSLNDQIYVPGCLFAAPEQRKGGFSVIKRLRIAYIYYE